MTGTGAPAEGGGGGQAPRGLKRWPRRLGTRRDSGRRTPQFCLNRRCCGRFPCGFRQRWGHDRHRARAAPLPLRCGAGPWRPPATPVSQEEYIWVFGFCSKVFGAPTGNDACEFDGGAGVPRVAAVVPAGRCVTLEADVALVCCALQDSFSSTQTSGARPTSRSGTASRCFRTAKGWSSPWSRTTAGSMRPCHVACPCVTVAAPTHRTECHLGRGRLSARGVR